MQALSDDQLFKAAPSIFSAQAQADRSDKYRFVPTIEVLDALRREGFLPVSVAESRSLDAANRPFVKHHIRLRREEDVAIRLTNFDQVIPEVALTNSHNGTSGFILDAALHRLVCSNGLVVADSQGSLRFRHSGRDDLVGRIIEGAYDVVHDFPRIAETIQEWRGINLDEGQRLALAEAAIPLRFEADPESGQFPVAPAQLLTARRYGDRATDLNTTFNVVQENLIRGGVRLPRSQSGRRLTSRKVTSVDRDLKINRSLWTLADALARHTKGEPIIADAA